MIKRLLLLLCLCFSCTAGLLAQTTAAPDTSTALHANRFLWYNCVVEQKGGPTLRGFGYKYFPYAPKGKFAVMPSRGLKRKHYLFVKVKNIQSIRYADLTYQSVQATGSSKEYLAREAVTGPVTLYVYTEAKSVPLPIPVAGAILHTAIPYDNSLLFLRRGNETVRINRAIYSEMMTAYFSDRPDLVEKIKNRTYKYRDTEALVREYNGSPAGGTGH